MKGSEQHYYTVRGSGFDLKQWSRVLQEVRALVETARADGLNVELEGNARRIKITSPDHQDFSVYRKGDPGVPKMVLTSGKFDSLVQTVLTAIKKIAPDIFVMTSPDGRDYRRLFAKQFLPGQGAWTRMKRLDQLPKTKEEAFLKAMGKQRWRHPETGNQVEFISLPKREQTKLRTRWEQEFGDRYQKMLEKARSEVEDLKKDDSKKEKDEADEALDEAVRQQEKAERAEGLKKIQEKAREDALRTAGRAGKKKVTMDETNIRQAAIRVASKTDDKELKYQILSILRKADEKKASDDEGEKESRFEEGKDVDVGTWLKQNGYEEAAKKWEKHEGDVAKKASIVFPSLGELAREHVVKYALAHPESKVASGSTRDRVAASNHLAKKWIQDAIKRPGRVRKYLGVPEGEDIPTSKLDEAIKKVKESGNKSLLSALLLAKRLKSMK